MSEHRNTLGADWIAERRLHREFRRPGANPLVVEGLTLQVIGQTAELSSHHGRGSWLKQVVERIESDYASPLTISALADAAGVHPVHLARTFKNEYGVGVRTYLESLRVARAREMLRAGEDSLATVAGSVGFCDQSHLTRAFKRATGQTPGQFRRRNS